MKLKSMLVAAAWIAMALPAVAGTAITYQGQLTENGQPFTGTVDMTFTLLVGPRSSDRIGNPVVEIDGVAVTDGLFQVELDFGNVPYEEGASLIISVDGDELSPGQPVAAAPLAVRSLQGGSVWNLRPNGRITYREGNVGIGVANPLGTLTVNSTDGSRPFTVMDQGALKFEVRSDDTLIGADARIQGNLGVGIGLSENLEFPLHVRSPDDASGGLFAAAISSPGSTVFLGGPENSQSAFFIGDPVVLGSNTELRVSSDASIGGTLQAGMVQVETLSTATDLELCRSPLAGGGAFLAFCSSSLRYKDDVSSFEDASEIIGNLRPVSFRWKDSGMESIGLIAEEVGSLDPRLVTFNDDGEIEGIKHRSLAAVLIKALQEQRVDTAAQLLARDAGIAALEAELDAQRRETAERLAALEALLLDGVEVAEAQ